MAINKNTRVAVYNKFDGHCAYCGRHIAYNDMQVDHFKPQRAWNPEDSGTDDIENLMPSCRMCNHYKRAHDLETFRRYIAEIRENCKRTTFTRSASLTAMCWKIRKQSNSILRK